MKWMLRDEISTLAFSTGCHATPSPACQVCQDQAYLDTLAEGKRVPFSSVQSLYYVELKSSLRLRLAH